MKDEQEDKKSTIEKIRQGLNQGQDKSLWKVRLLFLAPFIIAALIFLLLSLKG